MEVQEKMMKTKMNLFWKQNEISSTDDAIMKSNRNY